MRIRLTGMQERDSYTEEEWLREQSKELKTTPSHADQARNKEIFAAFQPVLLPNGFNPCGEFYISIPFKYLPAGAQLGDEFEMHFERARK